MLQRGLIGTGVRIISEKGAYSSLLDTEVQCIAVIMAPSPELRSSKNRDQIASTCAEYGISLEQFEELRARSVEAKAVAYCPYSNFRVGCAVLTADGSVVTGANVENVAYPVGTCAERVAIGKAVTEGHRGRFRAIAVATDISPPASPCGMCRQLFVLPRPPLRDPPTTLQGGPPSCRLAVD